MLENPAEPIAMRIKILCLTIALLLFGSLLPAQDSEQPLGDVARQARAARAHAADSVPRISTANSPRHGNEPVSDFQLLAWIVGGMPTGDLLLELNTRGISFEPNQFYIEQLRSVCAGAQLIAALQKTPRYASAERASDAEALNVLTEAGFALNRGQYLKASQAIVRLLRRDPNNADLYVALGNIFREGGDFENGAQAYSRATDLEPNLAYPHGQLSYMYYKMRDGRSAEAEALKMLALQPKSADAHKFLGLALQQLRQYDAALAEYDKALAIQPDYAHVYYDIGIVKAEQGNLAGAVEAYRRAMALSPTVPTYYYMLGNAYYKANRFAEAVDALTTAEGLAPDDLRIKMNLGNALASLGRYEEAIPKFRAILDVDPSWNNARQSLCYSLLQLGRREEAKKVRAEWPGYRPNAQLEGSGAAPSN